MIKPCRIPGCSKVRVPETRCARCTVPVASATETRTFARPGQSYWARWKRHGDPRWHRTTVRLSEDRILRAGGTPPGRTRSAILNSVANCWLNSRTVRIVGIDKKTRANADAGLTRVLCLIRRQTSTESTDFRLTSNLPKPPKNSNKISIPRREESSDGTRRVKRPCAACAGFVRLLRGISCRRVGAASQAGSLKGEALRSPAYGQPVRGTGINEARPRFKNGAIARPEWRLSRDGRDQSRGCGCSLMSAEERVSTRFP